MKNNAKQSGLLLSTAALFNCLIYYGGRQFARTLPRFNLTTSFDNSIPFLPWTIIIYSGAYLFWIVNYCLSTVYDKSGGDRFIVSHFIGEVICFILFILLPTTMIRPEITGESVFYDLLRLVYRLDSPDNLLPSIHCFASWLCWIGVRKNSFVPRWYQYTSLLAALAICLSTLTVKQHVIVDVIAGILLAEISYHIAGCGKGIRL